jgi:predicted CoA-binding protein
MPFQNPTPSEIKALLQGVKTIAVLGLSPKPDRPSYVVARAMQRFGYRIIPVRPATAEVLGEPCYPTLADIPEALRQQIDLVDVFRAAEHIPAVIEACLALHMPAVWIQEGIVHEAAAEQARAAGLTVVMDRCIYKDYVGLMTA